MAELEKLQATFEGVGLAEQGNADQAAGAAAEPSGIPIPPPKLLDSVFIPWDSEGSELKLLLQALVCV